jgi:hypothetical protein
MCFGEFFFFCLKKNFDVKYKKKIKKKKKLFSSFEKYKMCFCI